jgi:hypothetical protein
MRDNMLTIQLHEAVSILFPDPVVRNAYLQNPNLETLKKAFRLVALAVHPDCNGGHSPERFIKVNKAYESLTDIPQNELKRLITQSQKQSNAAHYHSQIASCKPSRNPVAASAFHNIQHYRRTHRPTANTRPGPHIPKYQPTTEEVYFCGEIPHKQLPLGMYLYYAGMVSFQMLAHALAWQRDMRPRVGALAKGWRWLDDADIEWILKATAIPGKFAERAYRMGYLTQQQLSLLLRQQKMMQTPFGQYFIANGILSNFQLNKALRDLSLHNERSAGNNM